MVIHFTAQQEMELASMAQASGHSPEQLVQDAALWLTRFQADYEASVTRSLEQAERGEFIEQDEMDARFAAMMKR